MASSVLSAPVARSRLSREQLEQLFPEAQLPTYFVVPPYVATRGPAVAELCESIGFVPDAEQRMLLDLVFAVEDVETLQPAVTVLDLIAPRQNMKSATFEMCCFGWLYLDDVRVRRVLWSAHEEKTSKGAQHEMQELIKHSWLIERQPDTRNQGFFSANDAVAIVTTRRDGFESRVDFGTRTKDGGRGGHADKLIIDEAYALQSGHMAALSPVLSTARHGQRLYGSSAARPESDVLRARVKVGREATGSLRAVYGEYCAPPPEVACDAGDRCKHEYHEVGCALGKPEMIAQANTQYEKRIPASEIDDQWQDMGSEAGRERLSWHDGAGKVAEKPLRMDAWMRAADPSSRRAGVVALGVEENGSAASFGVAGKRADGLMHVEVIDVPEGRLVDAVVAFAERHSPVATVLDGASPTAAIVPELLTRGFVKVWKSEQKVPAGSHRLLVMTAQETARACGGFVQDVRDEVVRHIDQPPLNSAVQNATGRSSGGGTVWNAKGSSVDITAVQAVTNARYGLVVFGAVKQSKRTWAAFA